MGRVRLDLVASYCRDAVDMALQDSVNRCCIFFLFFFLWRFKFACCTFLYPSSFRCFIKYLLIECHRVIWPHSFFLNIYTHKSDWEILVINQDLGRKIKKKDCCTPFIQTGRFPFKVLLAYSTFSLLFCTNHVLDSNFLNIVFSSFSTHRFPQGFVSKLLDFDLFYNFFFIL